MKVLRAKHDVLSFLGPSFSLGTSAAVPDLPALVHFFVCCCAAPA